MFIKISILYIDIIYVAIIIATFFLSPLLFYVLDKKLFSKVIKIRVIFLSFIFFCLAIILILSLRSIIIDFIKNTCFQVPYDFPKENAPAACREFNKLKYLGVGWPVTAMFWVVFHFIYSICVYILWVLFDFVKYKIQNRKEIIKPKTTTNKP